MTVEKISSVFEPFSKNNQNMNKPVSKQFVYASFNDDTEDTFYSRHKKAIITGGLITSLIALGVASKKGFLGESLQGVVNKIWGSTSASAVNSAKKVNTTSVPQQRRGNIFQQVTPQSEKIQSELQVISQKPPQATAITETISKNTPELPEFLYHFTSESSLRQIQASGYIKKSLNEQLPGVFLLDSENFVQQYSSVSVKGASQTIQFPDGNIDLLSSIFRHAAGKQGISSRENIAVIKIPTKELLQKGKLRIRTQEDFFSFQRTLDIINKTLGTNFSLRGLCQDVPRKQFQQIVLQYNLMSVEELNQFMTSMEAKIHRGYKLQEVFDIERTNAVEYIFNKDINLSDISGIQVQIVKPQDYLVQSGNSGFSPQKVKNIFEQDFINI